MQVCASVPASNQTKCQEQKNKQKQWSSAAAGEVAEEFITGARVNAKRPEHRRRCRARLRLLHPLQYLELVRHSSGVKFLT